MLVTLEGMATAVRLVQPANAQPAMFVTPEGIASSPESPPGQAARVLPSLLRSRRSTMAYDGLPGSTLMLTRLPQYANALSPMLVTLEGIVTAVRFEQP